MKKKVLMSLILLAIIGTSAVWAQQATLDKLTFTRINNNTAVSVRCVNTQISGEVVIPDTYEGLPVTTIPNNGFMNCNNFTSIVIPASVSTIGTAAFPGGVISVTFRGSSTQFASDNLFGAGNTRDGGADLRAKYRAGGAGTYTREAGGSRGTNVWTKLAGQTVCPHCGGTGFISR